MRTCKMRTWLLPPILLLLGGPGWVAEGVAGQAAGVGALRLPIAVKETAGVGAKEYPTSVVVPLPFGKFQDTSRFRLVDGGGRPVPAQFEALNRWWVRGNSIRHLLVHFQPTVEAFAGPGTGITTYYLQDDGPGAATETALRVEDGKDFITVITGPLKFTVSKRVFTIFHEVWLDQNGDRTFEDGEKIIAANAQNGGVFVGRLPGDMQLDSRRTDVGLTIEEAGPMRAVIRAEALTKYYDPGNHLHGFAVRIYAYANKPFVKVDYQLQNSAKNKVFSWPLYFKEMNLDFRLNLGSSPRVRFGLGNGRVFEGDRGDGLFLAQEFHDRFKISDLRGATALASGQVPDGFIDVSDSQRGVAAMIRYFWQMWPNGLEVDGENTLSLQLFPRWSVQWQQKVERPRFTSAGLYWLEDMQHVYKEALLAFHGPNVGDKELIRLAKTFQYHPVATLPTRWYGETRATLDMGGLIPLRQPLPTRDERIYVYRTFDFNHTNAGHYRFNWDNFYLATPSRKWAPGQGGSWPDSVAAFIATENPSDYYLAEQYAIGELNIYPHWLAQYSFERDWEFLQLTENPYQGTSWRKIRGGNYSRKYDAPFLEGTGIDAKPKDDEHAWFYYVEEAYYFTANPWIRDWYRFVGEFRKTRLHQRDPFPHHSTRAVAHALAHALQAYRITGDTSIVKAFREYINKWLLPQQDPYHGGRGGVYGRDPASWAGYLARAIISFMEEVRGADWQAYAEAFNLLSGLMEWNSLYANFSYSPNASKGERGVSSSTGQNLADPQAWYFLHTGRQKYLDHLNQYIETGINGGDALVKAYPEVLKWRGRFQGRYVQFVRENRKADLAPPPAIRDLMAVRKARDVELTWTAPADAVRYHIVWSDKPIAETTTPDTRLTNWWAAHPLGPDLVPVAGKRQSITITAGSRGPFYAAIFSFDANENMSAMSNVASIDD